MGKTLHFRIHGISGNYHVRYYDNMIALSKLLSAILVIKNIKFGTMKFRGERYHRHKNCFCSIVLTLDVFYDGLLALDVIFVYVYYFNMKMASSAQWLWSCPPFARKGQLLYHPSNQARQSYFIRMPAEHPLFMRQLLRKTGL